VKNLMRRVLIAPFEEQLGRLLELEVVGSCDTLLDIGCGYDSPVQRFSGPLERTVGIDVFPPYLERSRRAGIHSECRHVDALAIESVFGSHAFDCVLAVDLIEHLDKPDGVRLLEAMERVARRKVIVFTPNGFVPQDGYDENPHQAHRSGWTPDEMRARGYRLWGIHGWKPLRAERAEPRWRPHRLWATIALWTQPLVLNRPSHAYHLLCVKDLATSPAPRIVEHA
jgi:predicted TPR repeat methyltransferase